MDPVTHVVLGASLGYAAHGRRLGRMAAGAGALAGLAPDADVFIRSATDPLVAIEFHRQFTHALVFAPVGAAVVALPWWRWASARAPGWALWGCCLLAYVSHCLLDAATSYGTHLLWPFSHHRAGWDWVSIVDPVVTLPLLAGLGWALARRSRRAATVGVALVAAYLALGGVQRARAAAAQRELAVFRGHAPERCEVMPTLANQVVWRALYLHGGRIYSDRIRVGWFSGASVVEGWSLPRVTEADLTEAERVRNRARSFERFSHFSEGWVARKPSDPTVLGDMRYSLSTAAFDPIWGIRFAPPGAAADLEWVNHSRDRRVNLREWWAELAGQGAGYRDLADLAAGSAPGSAGASGAAGGR